MADVNVYTVLDQRDREEIDASIQEVSAGLSECLSSDSVKTYSAASLTDSVTEVPSMKTLKNVYDAVNGAYVAKTSVKADLSAQNLTNSETDIPSVKTLKNVYDALSAGSNSIAKDQLVKNGETLQADQDKIASMQTLRNILSNAGGEGVAAYVSENRFKLSVDGGMYQIKSADGVTLSSENGVLSVLPENVISSLQLEDMDLDESQEEIDGSFLMSDGRHKISIEALKTYLEDMIMASGSQGGQAIDTKSDVIFYSGKKAFNELSVILHDGNSPRVYNNLITNQDEDGKIVKVDFGKNMHVAVWPNSKLQVQMQPNQSYLNFTAGNNPIEFNIKSGESFYLSSDTAVSNITEAYMEFYPVQPYVETEFDLYRLIYAARISSLTSANVLIPGYTVDDLFDDLSIIGGRQISAETDVPEGVVDRETWHIMNDYSIVYDQLIDRDNILNDPKGYYGLKLQFTPRFPMQMAFSGSKYWQDETYPNTIKYLDLSDSSLSSVVSVKWEFNQQSDKKEFTVSDIPWGRNGGLISQWKTTDNEPGWVKFRQKYCCIYFGENTTSYETSSYLGPFIDNNLQLSANVPYTVYFRFYANYAWNQRYNPPKSYVVGYAPIGLTWTDVNNNNQITVTERSSRSHGVYMPATPFSQFRQIWHVQHWDYSNNKWDGGSHEHAIATNLALTLNDAQLGAVLMKRMRFNIQFNKKDALPRQPSE